MNLSVEDREGGDPMLFIHGWCGDRSHFGHQLDHFGQTHRVLVPDLPWHGRSPADGPITVAAFAGAIADHLDKARLEQVLVVGHSLGGSVALQLASERPDLVRGLVALDAGFAMKRDLLAGFAQIATELRTDKYRHAIQVLSNGLYVPSDDPAVRAPIEKQMIGTSQRVLVDGIQASLDYLNNDADERYAALPMPVAVLSGSDPLSDVARLSDMRPDTLFGQVVASGHYIQVFAAEQVNAMISQFVRVFNMA